MPPSPTELETALRDLAAHGACVKRRAYRQVWRVDLGEGESRKSFYIKLYPRPTTLTARLKSLVRGNSAGQEFERLVKLQKAGIPAARAAARLVGFVHEGTKWDAVVLPALPPGETLDVILQRHRLAGTAPTYAQRTAWRDGILEICARLARNGLGHRDLHLGNFYACGDVLYLLDGYAVRNSPLNRADLLKLGFSVGAHATRTDLLRGWRRLSTGPLPRDSGRIGRRQVRNYLERIWPKRPLGNNYFHRFNQDSEGGAWQAVAFHRSHFAHPWSAAGQAEFSLQASRDLLEGTLQQIRSGQGEWLKRGRSGEVWTGTVVVDGRPRRVVAKIPRRKYWYRHLTDFLQGDRSARAWTRAWQMAIRGIPVAWPLVRAARRVGPYIVEGMVISDWVEGTNLAAMRLADLDEPSRHSLMFRLGRTIRQIEQAGFCHFDTKASNWIIQSDPRFGPVPVIVDVDGIRPYRWNGEGMRRLRLSLAELRGIEPCDFDALELGFNPWAPLPPLAYPKQHGVGGRN